MLEFYSADADAAKKLDDLDWDAWFYKPGYPPKPDFDTSLVDVCYKLADSWEALSKGTASFEPTANDIKGWSANQSVVFLERVQDFADRLRPQDVQMMGREYRYASSQNVELVSRYLGIGLKARDEALYQPAADLLGRVGRMKFVRPLYRLLNEVDRDLAVRTFEKNKDFYHPICRGMVQKDLFGEK